METLWNIWSASLRASWKWKPKTTVGSETTRRICLRFLRVTRRSRLAPKTRLSVCRRISYPREFVRPFAVAINLHIGRRFSGTRSTSGRPVAVPWAFLRRTHTWLLRVRWICCLLRPAGFRKKKTFQKQFTIVAHLLSSSYSSVAVRGGNEFITIVTRLENMGIG